MIAFTLEQKHVISQELFTFKHPQIYSRELFCVAAITYIIATCIDQILTAVVITQQ